MVQEQSFQFPHADSPSQNNVPLNTETTSLYAMRIHDPTTKSFKSSKSLPVPTIHILEVADPDDPSRTQSDSGLDSPSQEINNNHIEESDCVKGSQDKRISAFLTEYRAGFKEREQLGLNDRMLQLDYCLHWIKSELMHLKEQRIKIQDTFLQVEHGIRKYRCIAQSVNMSISSASLLSHGSMDEHMKYDDQELMDQCEYEFRGRTSSLLLPNKSNILSPTTQRKPSSLLAIRKATLPRPQSLTHLHQVADG